MQFPWKKLEKNRKDFISSRNDHILADDTFVRSIIERPSCFEKLLIIATRSALAEECLVSREQIFPCDTCFLLNSLMGPDDFIGYYLQPIRGWMGFDALCFILTLEQILQKDYNMPIHFNIKNLRSLATFGKDMDGRIDTCQTIKTWIISLVNEICSCSPAFQCVDQMPENKETEDECSGMKGS
ncbi:MAG: hypothetical protein Q4G68_03420 [Planctomycetia bacterium]|nr:hypothetical protein [Planctomycetia bacterium]